MLRALGLFAVAGISAFIAMNNGVVAGIDLTQVPLEMIGFLIATGGIIYSLRYI